MSSWWIHDYYQAGLIVMLVSHIFWVIVSITLHELAHGWAAIWQGDDTPIRNNRMTMNPVVHMGPMSLLFLALVGIAWGQMPVDPSRFRSRRRGWVVVAGAGPAMNLALAVIAIVLMSVWIKFGPVEQPIYSHLVTFFFVGAMLNIVLMCFNLLPVPPLDGSSILSGLSFGWYRLMNQTNASMIGMFLVFALMISGVTSVLWIGGYNAAMSLGDLFGGPLGNPPVREMLNFAY